MADPDEELEALQLDAQIRALQGQGQTGARADPMEMGFGEALAAAARATPGAVVEASGQTGRMIDNWARTLASGATLGYADDIAAFMDSLVAKGAQSALPEGAAQATTEALGISPEFSENYAREAAADEAIPTGQRIAGEVIGGLATLPLAGAKAAGLTAKYAPKVAQAASRLPRMVTLPATGAAVGAAYGSGNAQPGERLQGALEGGALGAVAAPVGYYGMRAIGEGVGTLRRALENRLQPGSAAQRQVTQAFADDAVRPGQARVNVTRMGPQATLADAGGENVATLARRAASEPGPFRNRAEQTFRDRAISESTRIRDDVAAGLGPRNYYAAEDQMLQTLRNNARGLYDEAYSAGRQLESPNLDRILRRPVMRDAMKEASDLAQIEGRRVSPLAPELTAQAKEAVQLGLMPASAVPKGGVGRGISTEAIDDLKRGLDVIIDRERNQLTGRLNKRGTALNNLKREMLQEVDQLNPAYAQARRVYGGDAETLQALEQGRRALRQDPEVIARTIGGLSGSSQEAYRTGAARAIMDVVNKTGDTTSAANRLASKGFTRDQLRAIFPDEESYNRLMNTLGNEMRFQGTRNTVVGGSPTARIQADQKAWGTGALQDALTNPGGMWQGAARGLVDRLARPNPAVSNELADLLLTQGVSANRQILNQLLARRTASQGQQRAIQASEQNLTNALIAQQAGTTMGRY